MSALPAEGILDEAATRKGLDDFYADAPDADWQAIIDRLGWLLKRLYPAN